MSDHLNLRSQIFESDDETSQGDDKSHGVHSFQPDLFAEENVAMYAFREQDFNDDSLVYLAKESKRNKRPSQNLGTKNIRTSLEGQEFSLP